MSDGGRIELERPRDAGSLLSLGFTTYFQNLGTFLAIALAVVLPAELIVFGVGLEQLWSGYDETPQVVETVLVIVVTFLLITPLITAMTVHALLARGDGRKPSAGPAIAAGLEAFTPVFVAILLAAAGIALGLLLFIVPGIYVAVRWYFVPQAVIVEGARGAGALTRSSELVAGSWWRVFGVGLLASLIAIAVVSVIAVPLELLADSVDSSAVSLAGSILTDTLTTPFVAIVGTLLYFDLRARKAGVAPVGAVAPPPAPVNPDDPAEPPDPPGLPPR